MFENPGLLLSMNMAKWQVWLACLSDLAVYVGGLIKQRTQCDNEDIRTLLNAVISSILDEIGHPKDAPDGFLDTIEKLKQRIANIDYGAITDDEFAFTESPESLYKWAPIDDELKKTWTKTIVRNSVRFRWQEIRRSTRRLLVADVLIADALIANQTKT